MCDFLCHIVPTPAVNITSSSGILYAGSEVNLTCIVKISHYIDVDTNLTITWRHGIYVLTDGSRFTIQTTANTNYQYQSNLIISPLSRTSDPGVYRCDAHIQASSSNADSIIPASNSFEVTVAIQSMLQ